MEFWKKNKWKIIAPVLIVLVLAVAFVFGDKNIPEQKDPTEQPGISAPAQPTQDDEMHRGRACALQRANSGRS